MTTWRVRAGVWLGLGLSAAGWMGLVAGWLLAGATLPVAAQAPSVAAQKPSTVAQPSSAAAAARFVHPGLPADLAPALQSLLAELQAQALASVPGAQALGARVEVLPGAIDRHLKLAPCAKVVPSLPVSLRAAGPRHLLIQCLQGATAWRVYLPIQVKVWAKAPVLATSLPAGAALAAQHLGQAEVDLAAVREPVLLQAQPLQGRLLARALAAGEPVRESDLRRRTWFQPGETIKVVAAGPGYAVAGDAVALTSGTEGQPARAHTEGGRVLVGQATAERRMELNP